MRNILNNISIPLIDSLSKSDFFADTFINTYLADEWLNHYWSISNESLNNQNLVIKAIELDSEIRSLVSALSKTYSFDQVLGSWVIDKAFIYSINIESKGLRASELPHHDSVGKRLKIFVGLDKNINAGIYNRVYDLKPKFISNYNCNSVQRQFWKDKIDLNQIQFRDLKVSRGEFGIFNTNYIHEGIVSGTGSRNLIVIEVCNILKGKFVFGKVGAKI